MSLQFLLSSTVFPKLFLIAYRLWGTYCHQSPCSTLFQENIFNQISFDQKFRNLDLTQKRYVQMAVRNYKASTQECRNLFSGVDQELICPYRPTRSLRSESKNLLYVPACRTATYGNRLFTVETATLWNDLPQEVRDAANLSFKRLLKTHFFNSAFPQNCRSVCS